MSGGLAGIATGFTSFMSHAGGPPAAIYLLYAKSSKIEYPASTVIVFWLTDITKALPYSFFGNWNLFDLGGYFLAYSTKEIGWRWCLQFFMTNGLALNYRSPGTGAARGDNTDCDCFNLKNAGIPGAEPKVLDMLRATILTGS